MLLREINLYIYIHVHDSKAQYYKDVTCSQTDLYIPCNLSQNPSIFCTHMYVCMCENKYADFNICIEMQRTKDA